jgi:hypothetical protein
MYKDKGTSAGFNSAKEDAQNKKRGVPAHFNMSASRRLCILRGNPLNSIKSDRIETQTE